MAEVGGAFVCGEGAEEVTDPLPSGLDGSLVGFAQQCLELGEDHLDRVEIGAVGRQEEEPGADATDGSAHWLALMAAEVIGDDDVTRPEGWRQELGDPGGERDPIDRSIDDAWCDNAIVPQSCEKGQCRPMPVRHLGE